jgi:hypothetical protein
MSGKIIIDKINVNMQEYSIKQIMINIMKIIIKNNFYIVYQDTIISPLMTQDEFISITNIKHHVNFKLVMIDNDICTHFPFRGGKFIAKSNDNRIKIWGFNSINPNEPTDIDTISDNEIILQMVGCGLEIYGSTRSEQDGILILIGDPNLDGRGNKVIFYQLRGEDCIKKELDYENIIDIRSGNSSCVLRDINGKIYTPGEVIPSAISESLEKGIIKINTYNYNSFIALKDNGDLFIWGFSKTKYYLVLEKY